MIKHVPVLIVMKCLSDFLCGSFKYILNWEIKSWLSDWKTWSVGEGACYKPWQSEFGPWYLHEGSRYLTPECCSLISKHALMHACVRAHRKRERGTIAQIHVCMCMHTNREIKDKLLVSSFNLFYSLPNSVCRCWFWCYFQGKVLHCSPIQFKLIIFMP